MRKYQLTLICLFSSFYLMAQQQPAAREAMHMSLPKGTQKIADSQLSGLKARKFDNQKAAFFHDHIYQKDGLLLYYTYVTLAQSIRHSLENRQIQMVSLSKQETHTIVDGSRIITCNNNRYLIIDYHEGDEYFIWFSSDYNKNGTYINGFVQYLKADSAKANQYLNDFLPTVGFNN